MNNIISALIVCVFIVLPVNVRGQSDSFDKSLAKVGNKTITEDEFVERFEFTPQKLSQNSKNLNSAKLDFLYTLIAEKLWSLEAKKLDLDTSEVIKFSKKEFEKMFVRDELYKREITQKTKISETELEEAYLRYINKLYVNFIFSDSKTEIDNLFNLLNTGVPFDTILSVRREYEEQIKPIEVVYGQMDEAVEDSLYNLKLYEYTEPIFTPDGWYIFRLTNKSSQLLSAAEDVKTAYSNAKKIIKARKEKKIFDEFYINFFNDENVNVNPVLFESLADKLASEFNFKKNQLDVKENQPVYILANDVNRIESQLGKDTLSMQYINFSKNPVTLKGFFRSIVFNGLSSKEFTIEHIRNLLDQKTRNFIEQELLYREGIKKGYADLPSVQKDINMWYDNYLFQLLKNKFLDSVKVSDEEVYKYYKKMNQEQKYPPLVNIKEILTSKPEVAEKIMTELSGGASFDTLAKIYNERERTKNKNGEYGLFPIYDHGEIGKIASTMEVGEVYGPIILPEGYSIIKLIDKKEEKTIPPEPFEKFKEEYRSQLAFNKLNRKINDYTVSLALKYGVSIDINLLDNLEVTSIPAFAIRRLGFGGQVTAVPLLAPNTDWVKEWIQKQNQIP